MAPGDAESADLDLAWVTWYFGVETDLFLKLTVFLRH